jgi:hypothetical protein
MPPHKKKLDLSYIDEPDKKIMGGLTHTLRRHEKRVKQQKEEEERFCLSCTCLCYSRKCVRRC